MFYLSPTLTLLMLTLVPPVSLGAVRAFIQLSWPLALNVQIRYVIGLLWTIYQTAFESYARSAWRHDQSRVRISYRITHSTSV